MNVVDYLIKLASHRFKRQEKVFDDLVDPILNDLVPIHSDYTEFLSKALEDIHKNRNLEEIDFLDLKSRIYKLSALRDKCRAVAKSANTNESVPTWALPFFKAVSGYFSTPLRRLKSKSTSPVRRRFKEPARQKKTIIDIIEPYAVESAEYCIEIERRMTLEKNFAPPTLGRTLLSVIASRLYSRDSRLEAVTRTQKHLNRNWDRVLREYADCRIKCKLAGANVTS